MTDLQDTKYVVYESVENNESMMDTFVKHPIKTGMLNGKKYMVMETTNDDYWKDFMVEGQRVRTISKDAINNTRTIIFPYVEGKTLYDAIVKVHVKRLIMMDNTMSESLIKKHLQKPIPINLTKRTTR